MLLADLKKGEKAKIEGFVTDDIPAKFLEMGLVPGTQIRYKCAAPFDGPMCITLCKNKCVLALRKKEAACILIKKEA